jgi:hypothetical protein
MSVWHARGEWRLSTNGTIDAFKTELPEASPYRSFGDLFESVLPLSTFENYHKRRCWTFELVSPYNKIVIGYPKTQVYLLSVRNMDTLEELDLDAVEMIADANGIATPQRYDLNNEADYRQLVEQMPEGHEGIVVRDAEGQRVKIKTLLYFQLHKAKNNGVITLDRIVDLIRANDHHEFLSYFPEYTKIFEKVKAELVRVPMIKIGISTEVQNWKMEHSDVVANDPRMARKWFAQDVAKGQYAALYFAAYDNRLDEAIAGMRTEQFIHAFNIKED